MFLTSRARTSACDSPHLFKQRFVWGLALPSECAVFVSGTALVMVNHLHAPLHPRSTLHFKPLWLSLSHPRAVIATGCVEFAMPLIDACLLRLARGQLSFPLRGAIECWQHKSPRPCQPPLPPLFSFHSSTGPKSMKASVWQLPFLI